MFKIYSFDANLQKKLHRKRNKTTEMDQIVKSNILKDASYAGTPQFGIYKIEKAYNQTRKEVLFIDDDCANALLSMQFNATQLSSLPRKGTAISMHCLSTQFYCRGVRLHSAISAIDTYANFQDATTSAITALIPDAAIIHEPYNEPENVILKLAVNCNDGFNNYLSIGEKDILTILKYPLSSFFETEKITEILSSINKSKITFNVGNYSDQVGVLLAARLSAAIYIFNKITEGKFISPPSSVAHKICIRRTADAKSYSFSALEVPQRYSSGRVTFRQLNSDRYYTGKHAELPRGSRWVEVEKPAKT